MTNATLEARMTDIIRAPEHRLAGANALLWRRGELVAVACAGVRDLDAGLPVERDTVFRIASMSKPITTVAALMLLEEGRFELDEPINRWAPELGDMRVLRSPDGPLGDTVPAAPVSVVSPSPQSMTMFVNVSLPGSVI